MRKSSLPRVELLLSRKTAFWERRCSSMPGCQPRSGIEQLQQHTLVECLILAGGREVQVETVNNQINWNRIIHRNLHHAGVGDNLDLLTLAGYFQILHLFENDLANLLFGVTIHDREARLLLHLVL